MPSIYLGKTQSTYDTESSNKFYVYRETYKTSKLFKRFKHQPSQTSTSEDIKLYKEEHGSHVTLKLNGDYKDASLSYAHVYFNNQDTGNKNPLIVVLFFRKGAGGTIKAPTKYYKVSDFESDSASEGKQLNELPAYNKPADILSDLIKGNEKITEILTYDLGRTKDDDNGGHNGDNNLYNNNKIRIENESGSDSNISSTNFKRYKHTPSRGVQKACVIFDGNVLLQKDGKKEIAGIQNEVYDSIVVYMGSRAKKNGASTGTGPLIEVPLLIELTKQDSSNEPDYYVHKKSNLGGTGTHYYWEKLAGDSGTNTLKELLVDMGFGMSNKGDPGYKELKQLLTGAGVGSIGESDNLSSKLNALKGSQLQKLLSQTVGEYSGTGSQKSFLQLLLQKIEFDLLDSVIILLDKNGTGSDNQYNEGDVSGVVPSKLVPRRTINRVNMNSGGAKKITVNDATSDKGQCVQKFGYKLIKHDISEFVKYTLTLAH